MRRSIALVGIGKIALDQHVPAIAASPDWELAATVSRNGRVEGVQAFTDWVKATNDGLRAQVMLTARLTSGPFTVGFLCLAFGDEGGFSSTDAAAAESLRAFAEAVGDARPEVEPLAVYVIDAVALEDPELRGVAVAVDEGLGDDDCELVGVALLDAEAV